MASIPPNTSELLRLSLRTIHTTETFVYAITQSIWSDGVATIGYKDLVHEYRSYFVHIYKDLTTAACSGDTQIPMFTHGQILELVQRLKAQQLTKLETLQICRTSSNSNDAKLMERAVILAAGLLLPLNFKAGGGARRGAAVIWEEGDNLRQMVEKEVITRFQNSSAARNSCPTCSRITTFPRNFNARQLARIAGFRIIWTNNLLDHLLLQDDDESVKVHIFHQVTVLESHLSITK